MATNKRHSGTEEDQPNNGQGMLRKQGAQSPLTLRASRGKKLSELMGKAFPL